MHKLSCKKLQNTPHIYQQSSVENPDRGRYKRGLNPQSKQIGMAAGACENQIPKDWNMSLDESKVSTRPARMSSCESW